MPYCLAEKETGVTRLFFFLQKGNMQVRLPIAHTAQFAVVWEGFREEAKSRGTFLELSALA